MSIAVDSQIVAEYRKRTPKSAALAKRAKQVFPSGITHDSRYLEPYGIYVSRAAGSRKWDVDGHEYVDYAGGHGALLLGHNHPAVMEAVANQMQLGTHYGAAHELEVRWGEIVQRMIPSAERVRFTSSGTEATLLAMRLARAFTGRPKIMRFLSHFHGWHDHAAFGVASHWDGKPTPGVLPSLTHDVVLAPPGDLAATQRLFEENRDIAAVIVEPTGASWGQVPITPEFLCQLRKLTTDNQSLLIFDEVISGFRCSPGGAQTALGITPDLSTLAKIIAGGFPGGALVGKAEVMEALDFAVAKARRKDKVPHQGTFNANPISAAAGIATLEIIEKGDACERANRFAARLRDAMNQVLTEEEINWLVYGTFSSFHIFANPDNKPVTVEDLETGRCDYRTVKAAAKSDAITKLRLAMLISGVEIFSWPGGPTSAAHTEADLEQTITAFRTALRMLREEGLLPS